MNRKEIISLPVWDTIPGIDLAEMSAVKLMNRIDTKYLASIDLLPEMLEKMSADYFVQKIDNSPLASYDTIYFDTERCDMYLRHHDQQLKRQKIRTRTYLNSNISFLEIKNKTNKGRTKKVRIPIQEEDFFNFNKNDKAISFLNKKAKYTPQQLEPRVRTSFDRITLVNRKKTERLTIDLNLSFENFVTKEKVKLPKLLVIELKQDGMQESEMKNMLREIRIQPVRVSKYCVGTALTNTEIKSNRFKGKIRVIERVTGEKTIV